VIEVLVIDLGQDLLSKDPHQIVEVHHHARLHGNLAAYGDEEIVIVPVAVQVVARSVELAVFLVAEGRVVQPVGCTELFATGDFDDGHLERNSGEWRPARRA